MTAFQSPRPESAATDTTGVSAPHGGADSRPHTCGTARLFVDQTNITRTRSFLRFFRRKLNALAFPQ